MTAEPLEPVIGPGTGPTRPHPAFPGTPVSVSAGSRETPQGQPPTPQQHREAPGTGSSGCPGPSPAVPPLTQEGPPERQSQAEAQEEHAVTETSMGDGTSSGWYLSESMITEHCVHLSIVCLPPGLQAPEQGLRTSSQEPPVPAPSALNTPPAITLCGKLKGGNEFLAPSSFDGLSPFSSWCHRLARDWPEQLQDGSVGHC